MPLNTLSQIFNTTAIKAIPNQNNNLLDFVGTSGTTVASVTSGGLIDLRSANGTPLTLNTNDASVIGDKIRLWGSEFGLGIQNSRVVSYLPTTAAFAIRNTLTGSDVIKLNGDGNVSARFFDTLNNNGAYFDMNTGAGGIIAVNRNASHIPFTVRGAVSQSANLQEWQDSNGNAGTYITGVNRIFTSQRFAMNDTNFTGFFTVFGSNPGIVQSIIRGAASQTANLQEWQDSAGSVLARVDSTGVTTIPGLVVASQPAQINNTTFGFNIIPGANLGATTYWKIATLPATTLATYDAIYIEALLGGWSSNNKTRFEILMGNRDAFTYKHRIYGPNLTQARILAYTEANGEISVYLYSENTFTTLSYNISLVYPTNATGTGATIFRNPTGSTTAPTGTLVFDSSSGTYPALLNMDNSGNSLFLGNVVSQNTSNPRVRAVRTAGTAQTSGLGADSGIGWVGSETNTPFYLITNNTERMRIDASGNVNVGPATPAGGGTNTGGLSISGKDIEIMNIMGAY